MKKKLLYGSLITLSFSMPFFAMASFENKNTMTYVEKNNSTNFHNLTKSDIEWIDPKTRSIKIPLGKYVSESVYPNNNFVDATGGEILKALNQAVKIDEKTTIFTEARTINNDINDDAYTNWNEALKHFGLTLNENGLPNFKRDDSTGIFYVIAKVDNWKFIGDDATNNGDFTAAFRKKIANNPDIFELTTSKSSNTQGHFLIKVRSDITTTSINYSNDYESWNLKGTDNNTTIWNDIRNPLTIFNTSENQKVIKEFFDNKENLTKILDENSATEKPTNDPNVVEVHTPIKFSIDKTKEMKLVLPNGFGGTFTQDTYLYESSANDGYNRGEIPTLDFDFLKKVYESPYNFSNNQTNDGKIVYRTETDPNDASNNKKYEYHLKDGYKLNLTKSENIDSNSKSTPYTAYITNNDQNGFDYTLTVKQLKSIFDAQYGTESTSHLKEQYQKGIEQIKQKVSEMSDVQITYKTINSQNKPTTPNKPITPNNPSNNSTYNSGLSTGAITGISLSVILVVSFIVATPIFIRKRKNRK